MLPTCIGISGVSRYRNDASIEDSFLASAMSSSRYRKRGALVALLGVQSFPKIKGAPKIRTLVRIVHFPGAHMQWQTARIGQIA